MYEIAEENAKKANESSKMRRYRFDTDSKFDMIPLYSNILLCRMTRGIGTLKDLIKKADAGHIVKEDDIPPHVSVTAPKQEIPPAFLASEAVPDVTLPSSICYSLYSFFLKNLLIN